MKQELKIAAGVLALLLAAGMCPAQTTGYYVALEADDNPVGFFQSVTDLGTRHEVIVHMVMDQNGEQILVKMPGALTVLDITLARGITTDLSLWDWRQQVVDGDLPGALKDIAVIMYASSGEEIARWVGIDCWPSEIEAGLEGGAMATERLVLACSDVSRPS